MYTLNNKLGATDAFNMSNTISRLYGIQSGGQVETTKNTRALCLFRSIYDCPAHHYNRMNVPPFLVATARSHSLVNVERYHI